jgi:hypothetical protein
MAGASGDAIFQNQKTTIQIGGGLLGGGTGIY